MCGPLTSIVFQRNTSKWDIFQYHLLRLLSYVSLTIVLTIIGSVALKNMMWNRLSSFALWLMIAFVLLQIVYQFIGKKLKHLFPRLISKRFFPAMLGAVTGLLPCGLLIPAYIGASSMPNKTMAVLAITFFFSGTVPTLLMSQSILYQVKKKIPTALQPWINVSLGIIFLLMQAWFTSKH